MTWNLFSLVLASATGWGVLAIGFLPIAVLREQRGEAVKAAGAWAIVAATAPAAVYHWYLIFALICLVAWTKLDRPAGKMVLAIAASLGLSLGIVFPLEALPGFLMRENPLALASLYLGGATAGLAYAVCVVARTPDSASRSAGFARALLLVSVAWTLLLIVGPRWIDHDSRSLTLTGAHSSLTTINVIVWTPLVPAVVLVLLAFLALSATRRDALQKTRGFAGIAALLAFVTSLLAQFVLR